MAVPRRVPREVPLPAPGRVEALLRKRGPTSADRLASILKVRRTTVLQALHAHPLAFHNGRPRRASRWAVASVGSELRAVHFTEQERATEPARERVVLVCPGCGCTHAVPPGVLRKVEHGTRSARCDSCTDTRLFHTERQSLTKAERRRYARWWLDRYACRSSNRVGRGGRELPPLIAGCLSAPVRTNLKGVRPSV